MHIFYFEILPKISVFEFLGIGKNVFLQIDISVCVFMHRKLKTKICNKFKFDISLSCLWRKTQDFGQSQSTRSTTLLIGFIKFFSFSLRMAPIFFIFYFIAIVHM